MAAKKRPLVIPAEHITIDRWGADHWSTFMYIECRCVDDGGVPRIEHMRASPERHPQFAHMGSRMGTIYNTRLKNDVEITGHDDWDCVEDMIREGLLAWEGTGIHPVFVLSPKGWEIASAIRQWRAGGKPVRDFTWPVSK